jgi:hypothetical protein
MYPPLSLQRRTRTWAAAGSLLKDAAEVTVFP